MTESAISPNPIRVLPPGPFPPHGAEPEGVVDLGVRLRDLLYTRALVTGTARAVLSRSVSRAAQAPELLMRSQRAIELLIDSWPVGALVDQARERWVQGPDGRSLAVLERAAEIAASALGWPTTIDRHWPLPDERTMRELTGDGPKVAVRRGESDGATAVAVALDIPLEGREPLALPSTLDVHGDEIVARRSELLEALAQEQAVAVRPLTPVPWDEASQEVLGAIRRLAPAQAAFERYGQAGLEVGEAPTFDEILVDAPAQPVGEQLVRSCSVLVLPHLTDDLQIEAMGVLVWDAGFRPVRVVPGVAHLLAQLERPISLDELGRELDLERAELDEVVGQLAELGALRAVT